MSHKPLYIVLGIAALVVLGFLHWFIVPDLAVVTLDYAADPRVGTGFVKIAEKGEKLIFASKPVMVKSQALKWEGVIAWWPFAVASAVAGSIVGWFIGRGLQVDDFQAAAKSDKDYADQRLAEVERKRLEAEEAQAEAYRLNAQTAKYKRIAEQSKAETAAAQAAQAEAERKLMAERDRHKEAMDKAGARIKELKEKSKKNKPVDEA